MTAPSPLPTGPLAGRPAAGSPAADAVREAASVAREWAGDGLVALLLSGSHATGEAVWIERAGRRVTLSDVDLYAVMRDAAACRAAAERARAGRARAASRLRAAGIEAPLEVGFLTLDGLTRMPAKPGTIELARHGITLAGDASALERVPRWSPRDVPAEEAALLLENRGFELLLAWPWLASAEALERARARHGTLKAAADLAAVLALREGELPDGTAARVAWARPRAAAMLGSAGLADRIGGAAELDRLWSAAVLWRGGAAVPLEPAAAAEEWRSAARVWRAVWDLCFAGPGRDPWESALRSAARAPLPRRLRRGLRAAGGGSPARRVRLALAGTPQHRVNASATVLLIGACGAAGAAGDAGAAGALSTPGLPVGALRALRALGVTDATAWNDARRDVVQAWDELVLGGQRGEAAR